MLKPICTKLVFTRAFSGLYSSLSLCSWTATRGVSYILTSRPLHRVHTCVNHPIFVLRYLSAFSTKIFDSITINLYMAVDYSKCGFFSKGESAVGRLLW
jgi:hypothetical protein